MREMSGAQVLVESLSAHGVEVVFGIPGNHNLAIYEYLAKTGMRHILARHEQGCGFAADGYARVSGRPGVAVVTAGPAVLNTLAAMGQAYSDSVPVLLVAPGMPVRHPQRGNGHLHELKNQRAAVDAVVAIGHRVTSVAEVPDAVAQAFVDMTSGRPRPVYLEVPLDILDESAFTCPSEPVRTAPRRPPQDQLTQAAELIRGSSRPGLVVGGGARGAADPVRRLAERLSAPVVTTTNGKGVLPETHALSLGAGVHLAAVSDWVASRDLVLVVGSDLGSSDLYEEQWRLGGPMVRVDIDPVQIIVNASPDIALVGDASETLEALLERLGNVQPDPGLPGDTATWVRLVREEAAEEGRLWRDEIAVLDKVLDADAIVAGDSATVCYYGLKANLPLQRPGSFLYPSGAGTLGYGLPAAIGAKMAAPHQQVVAVMGDGGIMFSLAELASAAAEGLNLPVIVFDNGGYGQIRTNMQRRGYEPLGVDIPPPDFSGLARALGCRGVHVDCPSTLADALTRAFDADRPTVLHVQERVGTS